ncbi:mitochondrial carrier domain-containing protein [Chytriomyces cf. hyalinus JEL632]|nr:mitochondrial carrier domain-containing protein [Chytriomyces cf. hyalinus JEL632]
MPSFNAALAAGAVAGMTVDIVLFPLDTVKTRLQSKEGFRAAGGFRGIYSGLSSAAIGSAPGAAAFFSVYELLKKKLGNSSISTGKNDALIHMMAASGGEVTACLIRVPTEVVKQRMQTGQYNSVSTALTSIVQSDGVRGIYRGFAMTVFREIPFCCVQFPLFEYMKKSWALRKGSAPEPWEAGLCGSVAGGFAAAVTTPLDVVKTRIMLSAKSLAGEREYNSIPGSFRKIVAEEGFGALFKGIGPRVTWISIGGAVFLGSYEFVIKMVK